MFFTSLALPLSPSLPTFLFHATSRIPSWYIHGHLCLRACSQKWIAHDRRASERANSPLFSFLLAYSVRVSCVHTHVFAFSGFFSPFFFLSLSLFLRQRRRMHRRYNISGSQLSSSSSTSLYFYLLFIREWGRKKGEYQVIGQARITTLFLSLVLSTCTFITRPREKERKEKKRERERENKNKRRIHTPSIHNIHISIHIYIYISWWETFTKLYLISHDYVKFYDHELYLSINVFY